MKNLLFLFFSIVYLHANAQSITGNLVTQNDEPVLYANVVLHSAIDSSVVKIEVTDDVGIFRYTQIPDGTYYIKASYVGLNELVIEDVSVQGNNVELGANMMMSSSVELETATVTAQRAMVEVKADRKIFNVQGTINSSGDNGISLLRKAPGLVIDNNDNISVLGRSGVLIYVDGKRIPYSGDDLANYLRSLTSDQIDRVEIITNPGAKYEAEGNAGIIDIILKRDKSLGTNGSANANYTIATKDRYNVGLNLNHRNKRLNAFGSVNYGDTDGWERLTFDGVQNGFRLREVSEWVGYTPGISVKLGSDFYIGKHHTIGVLYNGRQSESDNSSSNRNRISSIATPDAVDSTLVANNSGTGDRQDNSYNLNYRYKKEQTSLNVDLDYGTYNTSRNTLQPNEYYQGEIDEYVNDGIPDVLTSSNANRITTPVEIMIASAKLDYEMPLLGGQFGTGGKLTQVVSDNTFLFENIEDGESITNIQKSNDFLYDEQVNAAYVSYARKLNEKLSLTSGLRMEHTMTNGELTPYDASLQEDPVVQDYVSWFPNLGFSYQYTPIHSFGLSYGRRINRPDYNVLNPFRNQISELSFMKGNPFLRPEIVNNVQLDFTYKYRYNFTLSYSRTTDQITRLIGPDDVDSRAGFINWDNLAMQTLISANASLPFQFSDKWNAFLNLSTWFTDNQADYGDGVIIDLQAFSYNTYLQTTYNLPNDFGLEMSGWFSGPGIWGGVFRYNEQWSLNFGVQKKFLDKRLVAKISIQDIFYTAGWSGESEFNGLVSSGSGNWDSRRLSLNLNYSFGNDQVKGLKRKSGIEDESGRVGS